ncbi:MAG: methyl-accepting chemotaxis protein, partial [Zoogloeaceae bacterium]|nr:methyl-accepting chemotaxis protein [Zoogloeaceae bacterium]
MLKNLSLGVRLGLGFISIVLVFAAVITVTYMNLREAEDNAANIRDFTLHKVNQAAAIRASMFQMRLAMLKVTANQGDRSRDGEEARKFRAELLSHIDEIETLFKRRIYPEEVETIKPIKENLNALIPYQEQLINRTTNDEAATFAQMSRHAAIVMENSGKLMNFENVRIAARAKNVLHEVETTNRELVIGLLVGILLSALLAFLVTRSITKPVFSMVDTVKAMAGGDLSQAIVAESKDEIGILQAELGEMRESFVKMISEIRDSAGQLSESSTELASAAHGVRKGSEFQSEAAAAMAA